MNVPPLPAQSGQPRTWGLALAQEAGLREEVRRLCAEAGARVRLPRAHSGRSDKPLMQSLDAKDGSAALPSGWPRGPGWCSGVRPTSAAMGPVRPPAGTCVRKQPVGSGSRVFSESSAGGAENPFQVALGWGWGARLGGGGGGARVWEGGRRLTPRAVHSSCAVFFRNLCARGSRGPEEQGGHDPGLHV